jgi:PKD repeat protein
VSLIRRNFSFAARQGAHALAAATLAIATGIAAEPGAALAGLQAQGWQSPADGGNGDYVFVDGPAAGSTAQGTVRLSGRAGTSSTDPESGGDGTGVFDQQSQVVIAMIDTGGNPYHVDFRAPTRLAHPSTYLTGFPANAKTVPLCFIDASGGTYSYADDCASSWQGNVAADAAVVNSVAVGDLVWYPGTKLMGKSFAHEDTASPVGFDQGGGSATAHGSWVSSVAVGNKFGNCPDCMLVVLEADTVDAINEAYQWAAEQPWIDVITSSITVGVIGVGVNPGIFPDKHAGAVKASENGKIFLTSSGNGAANFGLVPTSTFLYDGGSPALIPVGASYDDGLASHWSDFPAEIMANGNDRGAADTASMTGETAVGGTSFSSPGAAGALARSLLEARRACNDYAEGASAAGSALTLLRNNGCTVTEGPFADGTLTRDELHEAFVKNALPPYDQLSPIPGPVTWAKNAYGYVDLGHGINNGGSTIQPLVTETLLGTRPVPVRALEQFWYDDVVRVGQAQLWGERPVVDGDADAYPRADGACMPDCAPAELQRYAEGFAALANGGATYQQLFDVLGVTAEQFAHAAPTGFDGLYEPMPRVAGAIGEVGAIQVGNDAEFLTVRLPMAGMFDGNVPTVRSNPVTYEVTFSAGHNGVAQPYRLSYEFQAVDLLALLDGQVSEPLTDKFAVFVDALPDEQGLSFICPLTADLSGSYFDADKREAVWVVPLGAFNQDNRAVACEDFTSGGRGLRGGDTLTDIIGSAVLTIGVVNFGDGFGQFGSSEADDYTLDGGTPPVTPTVTLKVNGQAAGAAPLVNGAWGLDIDFGQFAAVDGAYVVEATFGTASDALTLQAAGGQPLSVALAGQCGTAACDEATEYETSDAAPLRVTLMAAAAGGSGQGRKYTFYFGDGTQSAALDASTVTHDYPAANADGYRVQVVVTEDNATVGAADELLIRTKSTINVEPPDVDTSAALTVDPASGAVPLTVTADAGGTQHATGTVGSQYAFDFADGTVVTGSAPTATHVYTVAGMYTVTVTVTDRDADGNVVGTSSASQAVAAGSANTLTSLLSVSPTTVKVGEVVTFDGCRSFAADGRTIAAYTFYPEGVGENRPAIRQDVSLAVSCAAGHNDASVYRHVYDRPGAYQPALVVTDDTGATKKSADASVKVSPVPGSRSGRNAGALGWLLLLPLAAAGLVRRRRLR